MVCEIWMRNMLCLSKKYAHIRCSTTQTSNKWVLDWEIHWLSSLATACSTEFLLPCLEVRVAVWLQFYMRAIAEVLFLSELKLLMPHSEHPAGTRTYCTLYPLEHRYHPISLLLNHNIFICSVYSALNLMLRNLTVSCIFSFYMSSLRWDIFYKTFCNISSITHTLSKYFHWTRFVQEPTFITLMTSLCETKYDCVSLILQCIHRKDHAELQWLTLHYKAPFSLHWNQTLKLRTVL
jgi:hypothetical protein